MVINHIFATSAHSHDMVPTARSGEWSVSGTALFRPYSTSLALTALTLLSACASAPDTHSLSRGPRVTSDGHYRSSTLRPYTVAGRTYQPQIPDPGYQETGMASWYGPESGSGTTANGEPFDPDGLSAAHRTFPLPSIAEVTNLDNGKSIRVRINDRGPFTDNRVIDLSRGAAKVLGVYTTGTARVRVTWLGPADAAVATPVYAARQSSGDDSRYIVQLGAFSQKDNADRAQNGMDDAHIDKRGGIYVVYLGPYDGAAAAETHRQAAIDAGFHDAILKRYE